MAKEFDLQLDLEPNQKTKSSGFDLGIKLDNTPTINQALNRRFPSRPVIQAGIPSKPTEQQVIQRDRERGTTISADTRQSAQPSLIDRAVGDTSFGRNVVEPISKVGRFFFPEEQEYYRQATEEDPSRSTDEIIARGRELMEKDVFVPPTQIGGQSLSPLDIGPMAAIGSLGRGVVRGVRGVSNEVLKRLGRETDEQAVREILQREVPGINQQNLDTAANLIRVTEDEDALNRIVSSLKKQTAEESFQQAPRRFTPEAPPQASADETVVYFNRTGGDLQDVALNPQLARQFGEDIEVGVIPTRRLQTSPNAQKADGGVRTITRGDADEIVFNNRVLPNEIRDNIRKNILDEADAQRFLRDEVLPTSRATPEQVLGREPAPQRQIVGREDTLLRNKLRQAASISRRASVATRQNVKEIQDDLVSLVSDLPLKERGKFIKTIKNIQTPTQLKRQFPNIRERVDTALAKMESEQQRKDLRKQVRGVINQKKLKNEEALRKAMGLPSLAQMTVDQLREFARTLADFRPGDRFLSQRVLETIDRTSLAGMKTYREVQERLAKEAGVDIGKLRTIKTSWYDKFLYDTALAEQNPFYDVVVRKINGSLIQGNIRFAQFEESLDELLSAARKSKSRGVGQRAVPTDEAIFRYIEAPNKDELVDTLTPEELRAANFLIERYEEAREYLIKQGSLDKYVQDYVTHIRRSGLEAFKEDGLISAFKETFEQYRLDRANFNILNNQTGEILPLEKFFAFAQQRTGNLKPSQNIGRASKAYFMTFERKRALDNIVPELQAYAQSVTPTRKTEKGLDFDPALKNFLKTYINNKRGRPQSLLFDPGTPPDVITRGIVATTRLIDLGLSLPNFVAANVGEQTAAFIQQGVKTYATGIKRANTKQGQKILDTYRGFVGRSPWKELNDTSKNFPDKGMSLMLSGFHFASVRANQRGLLGALTKQEFDSGVISPERLAAIRLDMGRWRALDNSSSIIGSTAEGKILNQYKAWAVPIVRSTVQNLGDFLSTTSRGQNPFTTRAGGELMRETMVVGTVAAIIYAYTNEEDDSYIGEITTKATRDALSAIGALDPEMWLATPRAWQYLQDVYDALKTIAMMEEYKTGEKEGTLKGDDQLLRLITPAPVRQATRTVTQPNQQSSGLDDLDIDLGVDLESASMDIGNIDLGLDL